MRFSYAGHFRTGLLRWLHNRGFTGKAWDVLDSLLVRFLHSHPLGLPRDRFNRDLHTNRNNNQQPKKEKKKVFQDCILTAHAVDAPGA